MDRTLRDLVGQRSGRLTVLAMVPRMTGLDPKRYDRVACQCDCGRQVVRAVSTFLETYNSSCGCAVDHTLQSLGGRRFGKLVAMFLLPRGDKQGRRWTCKCDCGRSVPVRAKDLRFGNTKSCGCSINRLQVNREAPSARQDRMLTALACAGSLPLGEVRVLLDVGQGAIGRNLATLERRGLVERRWDPARLPRLGWGGSKRLHLLPAGEAYVHGLQVAA